MPYVYCKNSALDGVRQFYISFTSFLLALAAGYLIVWRTVSKQHVIMVGHGLAKAEKIDGSGLRVGIVHARWNEECIESLVKGAKETLERAGVNDIVVRSVPGSYELPFGVRTMFKHDDIDVAIAIGVLIKGESMHFEYISDAVSHGLMRLESELEKPIIFGLLTCLTEEQALKRCGLLPDGHNHGLDWGSAAVEMAHKWKNGFN